MSTTLPPPTRQRYLVDQAEILRAVQLLAEPGQVVEVRAPDATSAGWRTPHVISGYFADAELLAKAVASTITGAKAIYLTLNPINPALLARAANRLKDLGKRDPTTADGDVLRRHWLPIDLDPIRPAEISSSEAEHTLALDRARRIAEALQAEGWPAPIRGDSGNGGHVLWRIDLPADDGGLVQQCLEALAARFDDALVKVDQSVFNPARIWKLYGTLAAKGDNTADRPHRLARLLDVPDQVQVVSEARLRALAATRPQQPAAPQRSTYRGTGTARPEFDLQRWISEHLPEADGPRDWSSQAGRGRKWVLDCPWNSDHVGGCAWIGEMGNGAISAGCQHQSCKGRGWAELRALKEPGYADRRNGGEYDARRSTTARRAASPPSKLSTDYRGPAIWTHADADEPIEITGQAGTGPDGRPYMTVANSTTAIPLDELHLPPIASEEPPGWLDGELPPRAAPPSARPVADIIAELDALRPEGGGKPERSLAEAKALDLVVACQGLSRADLQRITGAMHALGLPQEFTRQWRSAVREATRGAAYAAEAEIFTDGRPATWPYMIDERRLWLLSENHLSDGTSQIRRIPIADFTAQIAEAAIGEDGAAHWTIEGENTTGQPFTVEIPAAEFADERQLRGKLTQAAGPRSPVRAKMAAHLPAAIQLCSTAEPRQLQRFERTGWNAAGRFLIPGRELANTRISLLPQLPYGLAADANLAQGLLTLTDLIEAMGPERGMIILGHITIGPMAKLAGWENERSALFITGRTGTLKTSTTQGYMSIWGAGFLRDDLLIRWGMGATENAIITLATYAADLPLLIDNYKPGTGGGAKTFRNLIHAIVEGSEKLRLTRGSELRSHKLIATWPIFTGEDTPSDDAASLARVLVLPFDWPRGEANERLARAQHQARHLNAIGTSLLDWLESDASREPIAQAASHFEGLRNDWARRIIQSNTNATNPLRVASNIATNQLAIYILRHHPQIGPVIAPYTAQHEAGLLTVATTMAQRTAESLEATRFLRTLQELLATTELELAPESGKLPDGSPYGNPLPERRAGWRAEDGTVYLLAQNALSAVLKKLGHDALGNVSLQTLFEQIAALDLVASRGREAGRQTKVVRIAAEAGRPHRVLHLKAAALAPTEEEIDA